jgi:predicted GNAT family acetyltransferase
MKVDSYLNVSDFWQVAGPLFTADPVRNTIAMTALARLLEGGRFSEAQPIFLTVHDETGHDKTDQDGDDVIGAAFCTPPFPISVSALPSHTAAQVADYLAAGGQELTGASGTRPEAEAFAAAWVERTGARRAGQMDQRLYRLDELAPPAGVEGEPTLGTVDDLDLLTDWNVAFRDDVDESLSGRWNREGIVEQIRYSLGAGNAYVLWRVAGRPVSLAAVGVPKNGMSRIGPVYTPTELRGHGYGTAATAAAARWALDQGAEHVVLFTDLSNPVSNSIYQRIGFVPVTDALDVRFAPVRLT